MAFGAALPFANIYLSSAATGRSSFMEYGRSIVLDCRCTLWILHPSIMWRSIQQFHTGTIPDVAIAIDALTLKSHFGIWSTHEIPHFSRHRIERQQYCLKTWQRYGEITAVQSAADIEILKSHFPEVRFVETDNSLRQIKRVATGIVYQTAYASRR